MADIQFFVGLFNAFPSKVLLLCLASSQSIKPWCCIWQINSSSCCQCRTALYAWKYLKQNKVKNAKAAQKLQVASQLPYFRKWFIFKVKCWLKLQLIPSHVFILTACVTNIITSSALKTIACVAGQLDNWARMPHCLTLLPPHIYHRALHISSKVHFSRRMSFTWRLVLSSNLLKRKQEMAPLLL